MIKETYVKIKQITHNYEFYKDLGYTVTKGKELIVKITDLPTTSHIKIIVTCDICGISKNMEYRNYCDRISNQNFYVCSSCRFQKTKITNNLKYKVDNVFQLKDIKVKSDDTKLKKYGNKKYRNNEKIKKTCLEKYGFENVFQIPTNIEIIQMKSKNTRIKNGNQIPDEKLSNWKLYEKLVYKITRKNKKRLFENWNGFDYYDGEYIKDYFELKWYDHKYPSIDHKISTHYGFKNGLNPEILGSINNLCITKRGINVSKGVCNEKEFI